MGNNFKRFLAFVLAFAMVFAYVPANAFAAEAGETASTTVKVATLAELQVALAAEGTEPIEITAQIVIPEGETVKLDLNGKTVNSVFNGNSETNHIYALSNEGTLTITDTSAEKKGSINSRGINNSGSLTLEAGAINAIDGNGGYAVNNKSGSTFVMNGGTVAATYEDDHQSSSGGYDATALNVPAGCTATLNGGTVNSVTDFTFAISAAGTLNVPATSTVVVQGNHGAISVSGGTTTIDGGVFKVIADEYLRSDNVTYVSGGSLVINGGTFIGDSDGPSGGCCVYDAAGGAVINGGTFGGSSGGDVWGTTGTTIKGGTFENLTEIQHVAKGATIVNGGKTYTKTENGEMEEVVVVAKIGSQGYETLAAALAAAEDGDEIVLLADATPALTSQRAITKAAVIDLGGKTLTLTEDDLYFGTTTFKNGTIVVDPSVKPSTAVFWMFANQTLTFDKVKVVATGVTGTYLIGLEGTNSNLNLLNGSEILIENTTALDLDVICVNGSSGNKIVIADSKVNVTNLDGRVLFRGNYTIKGNSELNLDGITKAGIRIEAGQTLAIEDTAKVVITGEPRDGGIHLTDATATYTKAATATVIATVNAPAPAAVAYIGETGYATLAAAIAAAKADDTITVLSDVTEEITALKGNIVSGVEGGVTITSTYTSWVYAGNNFTIGEGVTFKTAYLFAYCKNGVINGTVELSAQLYMRYAGAKLTINAPGKLVITGENAIIRYMDGDAEAGLYINGDNDDSTVEFKAPYISFYSGIISAKDAVIETGVLWQTNSTDSAEHGAAHLKLDNSKLNMTVNEHTFKADDNSKIELINGSAMNIAGKYQVADSVVVSVDSTSSITAQDYTYEAPSYVAQIGTQGYETLQAAIEAVQEGETIVLLSDVTVEEAQATNGNAVYYTGDKSFTIDLNGKTVTGNTSNVVFRFQKAEGGVENTITIQNGKIVADENSWSAVSVGSNAETVTNIILNGLEIEAEKRNDFAVRARSGAVFTVTDCTITANAYGGGVAAGGGEVTLNNVTINQYGLDASAPWNSAAFGISGGGKMTINSGSYYATPKAAEDGNNQGTSHGSFVGIIMNSGGTLIINGGTFTNDNFGENSLATAARGVIEADAGAVVEINGGTFNGLKSILAMTNNLGDASKNPSATIKGGTFSADPRVSGLHASNLIKIAEGYIAEKNENGVYTVIRGLKGSGTEADPYLIGSVEDLIFFRDSVNAGETKYNAPGVWVALAADIDLAGQAPWNRGIGDGINATFDGIFDGKNHTIKNLNMAPKADSDGYVCGGLFGYTYGAVVIKNLTLENVAIDASDAKRTGNADTEPHNVGALVGFANNKGGKLNVSNVTVKNVTINAPYVDGVGAIVGYSYRAMGTIENCSVEGATITGYNFVGGITGYSYDSAVITGCSVNNATITATFKGAGGIAGLIHGNSTVTNNTVANTTVTAPTNWGYVVGEIGSSNGALVEGNAAAEPQVGGNYSTGEAVQAKIGNKYYVTLEAALTAAKAGEVIELLTPYVVEAGETVTLDLKGATIVYNSTIQGEAMITNKGTLTINDSVGGGVIYYNYTGAADPSYGIGNYTISNAGTLTVNGGEITIANLSGHAKYPIDNNSTTGNAVLVINDGHLYNYNTAAIRQFCNSTTNINSVTINGGLIEGYSAIWMQNPGKNTVNGSLTITGGEIKSTAKAYVNGTSELKDVGSKIYCTTEGGAWSENSAVSITGGTFNENVYLADAAPANITIGEGATFNGRLELPIVPVAKIGEQGYATINEALAAAVDGDTVYIFAGDYTQDLNVNKDITVIGETTDTGYQLVAIFGKVNVTADGATVKGLYVYDDDTALYINAKDVLIEGCELVGAGWAGLYQSYTTGTVTFKNSVIVGASYAMNFDGSENGNIVIDNCVIQGWTSFAATINKVTITGTKFADGNYNVLRFYQDAEVTNTTFPAGMRIDSGNGGTGMAGIDLKFTDCSVAEGDFEDVFPGSVIAASDVYVNNELLVRVAKIGNTYYETIAEAMNAAVAGDVIELLADVEASAVILIDKSLTINGNGHKVTSNATRVFRVTTADVDVTLNDVNMVSNAVRIGTNDIRGISVDDVTGVELTLNNCSVDFTDASANDWTYAVNVVGGSNHTVTVNGGTYEGANVINVRGANNTVTVKDATLNCLYPNNDMYFGACIWVQQNQNSSVDATGNIFNGDNALAFNLGTGNTLTESNNTDNTKIVVAKVNGSYYHSLAEAFEAAQDGDTIKVLQNIEQAEMITNTKNVTLDLNGKTISGTCAGSQTYLFMVNNGATLTIKDSSDKQTGKITFAGNNSTGWIVDVEGALVLESGILELTGTWSIGYAVDVRPNAWGIAYTAPTTFVMNGGKIVSSDGAVRVASSSADSYNNISASFTMNGGEIDAVWDGVFVQQSNAAWDVLNVTINGGTIKSALNPIRLYGPAATSYVNGEDCVDIELNGGTLTYTGTEPREWLIEGILRIGGGATAAEFLKDSAVTASETFAAANVAADGFKWVEAENGKYELVECNYVAEVNGKKYESLQAAINAAQDGDTVTLLADSDEDVTVVQAPNVKITIDGNGKNMTGSITVNGKSAAYATAGLTIQNVNFVQDTASQVFINLGVSGNNNTRYTSNVTVTDCTFTGTDNTAVGVKNYTGGCKNLTVTNCTATGMHSLVQVKGVAGLTISNVTITEGKNGIAVGTSTDVVIEKANITATGYGVRADGTGAYDMTVQGSNISANQPVVVRKATGDYELNVEDSTLAGSNANGYGVIFTNGDDGEALVFPEGDFKLTLSETNTKAYPCLEGEGTEDNPYKIGSLDDLILFRDSVNAGKTKYNAEGVVVALTADIKMSGVNWNVNIGDGANVTFDGIFDGKNHYISNMTITETAQTSDGYICTGLFGCIGGNAVIKNLKFDNAQINTGNYTGNNAGVVVGFAWSANGSIENVDVLNSTINANKVDGVGAIVGYAYHGNLKITNCSVTNMLINGQAYVGGVVGYGGGKMVITNTKIYYIAVNAYSCAAGGIAGILLDGGEINTATVEKINALTSAHDNWQNAKAIAVGCTTGTITVANVTAKDLDVDVTAMVGAVHANKPTTPVVQVPARVGNVYYTTLEAAVAAANGAEVALLCDSYVDLVITAPVVLNLNNNAYTGKVTLSDTAATLTAAEGLTVTTNVDGYEVKYENGVYKVVEKQIEIPKFDWYGTNLNLGNNLDMVFAFSMNAVSDWTGHYVEMVRSYADGTTETITVPYADWQKNGAYYTVSYGGFAAKEMCDQIALTVYNAEGKAVSFTKVDSIRDYAMRMYDKATSDLARTAFVDLLNYGTAAQKQFKYGEDDYANALLDDEQKAMASDLKAVANNQVGDAKFYGTNVIIESNIIVQMAFRGVTDDMYAVVEFIGHAGNQEKLTIQGSEFAVNGSFKVMSLENMVIADARSMVSITIYNADGSVYVSVQDSIESYVARNLGKSNLFEAFMIFADTAHAYLHRNDK